MINENPPAPKKDIARLKTKPEAKTQRLVRLEGPPGQSTAGR